MPFDPNVPVHNAELTSAMFRGQFTGLKDLIDAIQGGITSVVVDAVNTLPAGSQADVGVGLSGTELHFTFGIPQGQDGATGQPGEVSLTDLNNAQLSTLSQCSNNSNGVGTIDTAMADPDMETLRQKLDELINALRR